MICTRWIGSSPKILQQFNNATYIKWTCLKASMPSGFSSETAALRSLRLKASCLKRWREEGSNSGDCCGVACCCVVMVPLLQYTIAWVVFVVVVVVAVAVVVVVVAVAIISFHLTHSMLLGEIASFQHDNWNHSTLAPFLCSTEGCIQMFPLCFRGGSDAWRNTSFST